MFLKVIAWQGILWVAFSVYVIIRLIWVEISPSKTATCSWRIGNPDVIVKWRKEFTYGLDAVFILILLACYVIEFVLLVRLTENDVDFQDTTTEDWVSQHWFVKLSKIYPFNLCFKISSFRMYYTFNWSSKNWYFLSSMNFRINPLSFFDTRTSCFLSALFIKPF